MPQRDDFAQRIGARIRQLRREAGMTQRDLAGDDMSPGFISQVERGLTSPSLQSLQVIALNLGVETSALMPGPRGDGPGHRAEVLLSVAESQRLIGQTEQALLSVQRARDEMTEGVDDTDPLHAAADLQSGLAHLERGAHDRAFADLTAAVERFEAGPDLAGTLKCLLGLGEMHLRRHNPLLAIRFFETTIRRAAELQGEQRSVYQMLAEWGLGRAYQALKETETANEILGRALQRARRASDITGQVTDSVQTALDGLAAGEWDRALRGAARAHTLSALSYMRRAEADILHIFGLVCEETGERKKALSALEEAADIASRLGEPTLLARILLASGTLQLRSDQLAEASSTAAEALEVLDPDSEPVLRGRAALLAGRVALVRHQHCAAERLLTEAETCFRAAGALPLLAQSQAELGRVYLATGRRDQALHRFRRASNLFSRISQNDESDPR
ncbi:MAG: helix-turn-helix transcriptional regulator [Bacillota bacterium]